MILAMLRNRIATSPPAAEVRPAFRRVSCLAPLALAGLLLLAPLGFRWAVKAYYSRHIYAVENAPARPVAVVFGASVRGGDRLSTVLRDRMDTAIALYRAGKVGQLLVSGGHLPPYYDEPSAMRAYAVAQGVPVEAVLLDYGGNRTYDSCYHLVHSFHIREALLVTQDFHLPRALFICRWLGVTADGVSADLRPYRAAAWYDLRETAATIQAFVDVVRRQPPPSSLSLPPS
jgi:SanA protein